MPPRLHGINGQAAAGPLISNLAQTAGCARSRKPWDHGLYRSLRKLQIGHTSDVPSTSIRDFHALKATCCRCYACYASQARRARDSTEITPIDVRRTVSISRPILDEGHLKDPKALKRLVQSLRRNNRRKETWDLFQALIDRRSTQVLAAQDVDDETVCDDILWSALGDSTRVVVVTEVSKQLQAEFGFQWPGLYVKIIHWHLAQDRYDEAVLWHFKISPNFSPNAESFAALLSSFVVDADPKLQKTLMTLYIFNTKRNLYDTIIPALFLSGNSRLARDWRRFLNNACDDPVNQDSLPFLDFLSRYYPTVSLTERESAIIAKGKAQVASLEESYFDAEVEATSKGSLSDIFVARLFASSWTSVEFVIHLVHGLGLKVVGPISMQSLALRDQDADTISKRITQLEKMDMKLSDRVYCKVLSSFACHGQDKLLDLLLHCDIHPDEFEDAETRRLLLESSVLNGDSQLEELLQGVDSVIGDLGQAHTTHVHANTEIQSKASLSQREDTNHLPASNDDLEPLDATKMLRDAFRGMSFFPRRTTVGDGSHLDRERQVDNVVRVIRQVSAHDVAIPLILWKRLLYNLGRLHRFNELHQMSLEIVNLYDPSLGGQIPIYKDDMPPLPGEESRPLTREEVKERLVSRKLAEQTEGMKAFEKEYIPADLPFSHRQHPIQKIFDQDLQRSIVRWGFDQALRQSPHPTSLVVTDNAHSSYFDVARGVRLLAILRDHGVLVNEHIVRSSIMSRMALATVQGRKRARARDSYELLPQRLKKLIDAAWGSELLSAPSALQTEVGQVKDRVMRTHRRLRTRYRFST